MFNKKKQKYTIYEADDTSNNYNSNPNYCNDFSNNTNYKQYNNNNNNNNYDYDYGEDDIDKKNKKTKCILVGLFIYIIFVVIGFISTTFLPIQNTDLKEAQIVNIQLRKDRENYYELKKYYISLNNIINETYNIDKQLSNNTNKSLYYVTSYQNILSKLDKLLPKVRAMNVSTKYEPLKKQNIDIYDDLANYLQLMSSALSTQDAKTLSKAVSWRNKTIEDYNKFSQNIYDFSRMIKLPNDLTKK